MCGEQRKYTCHHCIRGLSILSSQGVHSTLYPFPIIITLNNLGCGRGTRDLGSQALPSKVFELLTGVAHLYSFHPSLTIMGFTTTTARPFLTKLRRAPLALPIRMIPITKLFKESLLQILPSTLSMLGTKGFLLLFIILGAKVALKVFFKTHCLLHSLSKSIHSRGYNEGVNPTIKAFLKLFHLLGLIQDQVRSKARQLNKAYSSIVMVP